MQLTRHTTRTIKVGGLSIGGTAPIAVQTMAKADPHDAKALLTQIREVAQLGCDLVRLAVPDMRAVDVFKVVRRESPLPLVADVHFDHRLALALLDSGADGLRLNPGNIGERGHVKAVAEAARGSGVPIRIGVNGGSLERDLLKQYGAATPEALVESALRHLALLEEQGFEDIKISVKASDVPRTVEAYRLLAKRTDHPLHLGVTEAGTFLPGTVRSCVALGSLLLDGIGDTIRVSLTDKPAAEVRVGIELLRSLGLRSPGAAVTSCPTCGRTQVDVAGVAARVEEQLERFYLAHPEAGRPLVAIMGCLVNGPGEARHADIAVVGGINSFSLFVKGQPTRNQLSADEAIEAIVALVAEW